MTRTYPPDEFDVDDPGTGRRGAHRAKPNPLVAVVPLVLVTVAVVAVIVGTMTLLGGPGGQPTPATGGDLPASEPAEPSEPTASETSAPPAETTEPTEPAEPEPTVDQSLPVTVLNGVGVAGLAGDTAERLTAAGFNVVGSDNFTGGEAPPTTVFYATEEQSATADAIIGELGVGVAELDPEMGEGLTVVIGEDYQP